MKPIKLRAWAHEAKTMHPIWVVTSDEGGRYILMQYTGVNDKNGKEIYDGDIVKDLFQNEFGSAIAGVGKVMWCKDALRWELETSLDEKKPNHWSFDNRCEVIGNIYENPELFTENTLPTLPA